MNKQNIQLEDIYINENRKFMITNIKNKIVKTELDENGNLFEYDNQNKILHYKSVSGFEDWRSYDSTGNLVYYINSNGFEDVKTYENNVLTKWNNSEGTDIFRIYTDFNDEISVFGTFLY